MTPVAVRNRLVLAIGIDMSKYANDLAAVHTILKRLNSSGELRFIAGTRGHSISTRGIGRQRPPD